MRSGVWSIKYECFPFTDQSEPDECCANGLRAGQYSADGFHSPASFLELSLGRSDV